MTIPYTSAYLLSLLQRLVGRNGIADAVTTQAYYDRLSEAQQAIVMDIASISPQVLYQPITYADIPTLNTSDNQTFDFGTDENGDPITPMGKAGIYTSLNNIPSNPWREGWDYVALGATAIQIPNNNTYSGTLYWRGIQPPSVIDASTEPVLFPLASRQLIAYRAAIMFASEFERMPGLAAQYMLWYGRPYGAQPGMFASWMLSWQNSYQKGGVLGRTVSGVQVAAGSYTNNAG